MASQRRRRPEAPERARGTERVPARQRVLAWVLVGLLLLSVAAGLASTLASG